MDGNRNRVYIVVLVLLGFVSMAAQESNASLLSQFRKLVTNNEPSNQIFPAPTPAPSSPELPGDRMSFENCTSSLQTCKQKSRINITACLISLSNAKNELYLLIQNQEESSVEVNVTTNNATTQIIPIPKHDIKKVSVTDGKTSPIVLKFGTDNACVIHFESQIPLLSLRHFHYYSVYATPLNGAYLLALTFMIFGGTWACCLLRKKESRVDGVVSYQELEMGRSDSPADENGETDDRWEQGWDDDWGEIKAVRSPNTSQNGKVSMNGIRSTRTNDGRGGWENTWDD